MDLTLLVLATIITAATPLLLAALGEHVTEKAGVLNLGVEGMMIVGASAAFAAASLTGSGAVGAVAGILAGMAMAALFALFVLVLATNQVATGLALTIFGIGFAGLIGAPFVGSNREPIQGLPFTGALKLLLGQDPFVYAALLLTIAVAVFLRHGRPGLLLRGVGENHDSAHALGLPVRAIRFGAILFGGAMSGLAGSYLSLVYTPFWSPGLTAGRGWIALALVVFAGGRVWRLVLGAYLFGAMTVAQLHAQAGSIGLPSQLLSALPYATTILALVVLAGRRGGHGAAPGALGRPFIPDR